ncbi:hypothetical protein [Aromatoleum aromaticum]|uniref:hypothetical protein n=1 Tax=Aromatoleum aromaticum TaxID=551760 RepID=UPI0006747869|nr:hypothetical protein [Aromatoleum aromaticum]
MHPIVYIDTSSIRDGKLEELKVAMKGLAAFVEANMPQLTSYGFFLDETQTQMTVVAVHPNSESLEFHMDVGSGEFRKFVHLRAGPGNSDSRIGGSLAPAMAA